MLNGLVRVALAAFAALVAGVVLILVAPASGGPDDSGLHPAAIVGALLATVGAVVLLPSLLLSILVASTQGGRSDEAHLSLPEQLIAEWRQAGRVQRLSAVVLVPLALVFLFTGDAGLFWLLLGLTGAVLLIDDYLSPDGRLASPRRRGCAVVVVAALLFFGGAWLMEPDDVERWSLLLFVGTCVVVGLDQLISKRRSSR